MFFFFIMLFGDKKIYKIHQKLTFFLFDVEIILNFTKIFEQKSKKY